MNYKLRDLAKQMRDRIYEIVKAREFDPNEDVSRKRWIDDNLLVLRFDEWVEWADKRKLPKPD